MPSVRTVQQARSPHAFSKRGQIPLPAGINFRTEFSAQHRSIAAPRAAQRPPRPHEHESRHAAHEPLRRAVSSSSTTDHHHHHLRQEASRRGWNGGRTSGTCPPALAAGGPPGLLPSLLLPNLVGLRLRRRPQQQARRHLRGDGTAVVGRMGGLPLEGEGTVRVGLVVVGLRRRHRQWHRQWHRHFCLLRSQRPGGGRHPRPRHRRHRHRRRGHGLGRRQWRWLWLWRRRLSPLGPDGGGRGRHGDGGTAATAQQQQQQQQ